MSSTGTVSPPPSATVGNTDFVASTYTAGVAGTGGDTQNTFGVASSNIYSRTTADAVAVCQSGVNVSLAFLSAILMGGPAVVPPAPLFLSTLIITLSAGPGRAR